MQMTMDEFVVRVTQDVAKLQVENALLLDHVLGLVTIFKQTAITIATLDPENGRTYVDLLKRTIEFMKQRRPNSPDYVFIPEQLLCDVSAVLETGRPAKPRLELVVDNTDGGRIDWQPPASAKSKPKPDLKLVWDRDNGGRLDRDVGDAEGGGDDQP